MALVNESKRKDLSQGERYGRFNRGSAQELDEGPKENRPSQYNYGGGNWKTDPGYFEVPKKNSRKKRDRERYRERHRARNSHRNEKCEHGKMSKKKGVYKVLTRDNMEVIEEAQMDRADVIGETHAKEVQNRTQPKKEEDGKSRGFSSTQELLSLLLENASLSKDYNRQTGRPSSDELNGNGLTNRDELNGNGLTSEKPKKKLRQQRKMKKQGNENKDKAGGCNLNAHGIPKGPVKMLELATIEEMIVKNMQQKEKEMNLENRKMEEMNLENRKMEEMNLENRKMDEMKRKQEADDIGKKMGEAILNLINKGSTENSRTPVKKQEKERGSNHVYFYLDVPEGQLYESNETKMRRDHPQNGMEDGGARGGMITSPVSINTSSSKVKSTEIRLNEVGSFLPMRTHPYDHSRGLMEPATLNRNKNIQVREADEFDKKELQSFFAMPIYMRSPNPEQIPIPFGMATSKRTSQGASQGSSQGSSCDSPVGNRAGATEAAELERKEKSEKSEQSRSMFFDEMKSRLLENKKDRKTCSDDNSKVSKKKQNDSSFGSESGNAHPSPSSKTGENKQQGIKEFLDYHLNLNSNETRAKAEKGLKKSPVPNVQESAKEVNRKGGNGNLPAKQRGSKKNYRDKGFIPEPDYFGYATVPMGGARNGKYLKADRFRKNYRTKYNGYENKGKKLGFVNDVKIAVY